MIQQYFLTIILRELETFLPLCITTYFNKSLQSLLCAWARLEQMWKEPHLADCF